MEEKFSIQVLNNEIFTTDNPLCQEEITEKVQCLEEKYQGEIKLIEITSYIPMLIKDGD